MKNVVIPNKSKYAHFIKEKAKLQGRTEEVGNRRALTRWCSFTKQELRANATNSEKVFMAKLLDAGFIFHNFQKVFYQNDRAIIADFFIRKPHKLVIEIDGGYHLTDFARRKDLLKDRTYLLDNQVNAVLRLTNEQAEGITIEELKALIEDIKKGEVRCLYNR